MRELFKALFDLEEKEYIEIVLKLPDKEEAEATFLAKSVEEAEALIGKHGTDAHHIWFGVAPRFNNSVRRLAAVWLDVDAKDFDNNLNVALKRATESIAFPPSCLVQSGNGYHVYWFLTESTNPSAARKILTAFHKAAGVGATYDPTRMLRVPGTMNPKYDPPRECQIEYINPDLTYNVADLMAVTRIDETILHRIMTGDAHDFPSRSERDWAVIRALQIASVSTEGITTIFEHRPVGDKYRQEGTHYLSLTMEKSKASLSTVTLAQREDEAELFQEREDGTWFVAGSASRQVSSFVFKPTQLVKLPTGDVYRGTITTTSGTSGIELPRSAFSNKHQLSKHLTSMAWAWLGTDAHLGQYQMYLHRQFERLGGPRTTGVQTIGRHGDVWVLPDGCITLNGHLTPEAAPFAYVHPTQHYAPEVEYDDPGEGLVVLAETFADLYPKVNKPAVALTALGWFCAALVKPLLGDAGYSMPNLSVWGTRGAGKTSLINLLRRLTGVVKPQGQFSGGTFFVISSHAGSTTSIPIHLTEFRNDNTRVTNLKSIMQTHYDSGRDARGRSDQSVVRYDLTAPIVLDGEDMFEEASIQERMVSISMSPETIEVYSEPWYAFKKLNEEPVHLLALPLVRFTLTKDAQWVGSAVKEQLDRVSKILIGKMPDRVHNNTAVCLVGWLIFYEFMQSLGVDFPYPAPATFMDTITDVVNLTTGHGSTLVDEFITDVINEAAAGGYRFPYKYDTVENVIWFQLTPAMKWWLQERRRSGQSTLGTVAIKRQLRERVGQYMTHSKTVRIENKSAHCYGVSLDGAVEAGLDVPTEFDLTTVTMHIGGSR